MPTSDQPLAGTLHWIGVRIHSSQPMQEVTEVACHPTTGLAGDRYSKPAGKRQVTIVQREQLQVLADRLSREHVPPELLRRNLVVSGCDVKQLIGREFTIGNVRFIGTGDCPPCNRMDQTLGPGGLDAMQGLGGITARIVTGGPIQVGQGLTANL